MGKLFVKLLDKITISQMVYFKAMFITTLDLTREWYGMLVGKVELSPNPNNPLVNNVKISVDDLLIPEQQVSGSDVRIEQESNQALFTDAILTKLAANNQRIVGWIHSHGCMGVFLSGTDLSNIIDELNMLPLVVSIVCSYSPNTEYSPEKNSTKDSQTPTATSPPVKLPPLPKKLQKAMRKIEQATHLTTDEKSLLIGALMSGKKWKKNLKKLLKKMGKTLHPPAESKKQKRLIRQNKDKRKENQWHESNLPVNSGKPVNLHDYFTYGTVDSSSRYSRVSEFHMGVWFSHRPPFSEQKMTSRNLVEHSVVKESGHQVVEWPSIRPRQLSELEKHIPSDVKLKLKTLAAERIKKRHALPPERSVQPPYSRITRFLGEDAVGGVNADISSCYAPALEVLIGLTSHMHRIIPKQMIRPSIPSEIDRIDIATHYREGGCSFCGFGLDINFPWSCNLDCDILLNELGYELGFEPDQLRGLSIEQLEDEHWDSIQIVFQELYVTEKCAHCLMQTEAELVCSACDLSFNLNKPLRYDAYSCLYCNKQYFYYVIS